MVFRCRDSLKSTRTRLPTPTARFTMQPLERGFGVTVGHAIRRVLVSSIQGSAIKSVSVEDVQHEFSVVKGVREDLPEIVLNLKEVAIRYHGEEDRILHIEAEGPKELVAGDLRVDSAVEVLNPDLHIATLGKEANLILELAVGKGRGYVFAEENQAFGTADRDHTDGRQLLPRE